MDVSAAEHRKPDADPYTPLLELAASRACHYLATIDSRRVGPSSADVASLVELGGAFAEDGRDPEAVLDLLDRVGSPATMAVMGRRFFGGVIGGSLPVTVAAHWLADAWDQNACLFELSPVAAYLEEVVLRWLIDLFGLPQESAGALVVGTQTAHVTALAAARHALLAGVGWDVEQDGLFGAPPITVVVGEEVHATLLKALSLVGLGCRRVVTVPVDSQGRMQATELPKLSGPAIICAQLGNVDSGCCDPLEALCEAARQSGAWVHVDGAFGLWASTAPARRHLTAGLELADSWATDGHKWLNTPQDCGIAIVRHAEALRGAMQLSGAYYGEPAGRDPMRWCPDSSRRARAIELWAALCYLGRRGISEQIERTCRLAERFANGLRRAGHEILNEVALNQALVSFGSDALTDSVIKAIQDDGVCWCGGTAWHGRRAMRISVSSWATTEADVDTCLKAMDSAYRRSAV
ncbi:MAG: pyridoxal phosphate-dependent decarboxylase family protein [Steroidobacteraceae bacterium]